MTSGYANKHGPQIYEKVYLWLASQYYYPSACFAKSKLLCFRKHMTVSPRLESPMFLSLGAVKKKETVYPISCPFLQEWAFRNNPFLCPWSDGPYLDSFWVNWSLPVASWLCSLKWDKKKQWPSNTWWLFKSLVLWKSNWISNEKKPLVFCLTR